MHFYIVFILSCLLFPDEGLRVNPLNCRKFQEGSFIYKEKEFKGVKVKRLQNEQIETVGDSMTFTFSINWNSGCTYTLVPKRMFYKSLHQELPKDTIYVTITAIQSDTSYRYVARSKGVKTEYTMIKLKEK